MRQQIKRGSKPDENGRLLVWYQTAAARMVDTCFQRRLGRQTQEHLLITSFLQLIFPYKIVCFCEVFGNGPGHIDKTLGRSVFVRVNHTY